MGELARLTATLAAITLATTASSQPAATQLQGIALVRALQHGGLVLIMRHAHAPMAPPDAGKADVANPSRERQLDQLGRSTAVAMGQAIRSLRIRIGATWSSPTYRARETARLAGFPPPKLVAQLGDQGRSMQAATNEQGAWLRRAAAQPPRPGTDSVIVTQLPNISAAFGQAAAGLGDGGTLVFRPQRGRPPELVGRIAIEQWPSLNSH